MPSRKVKDILAKNKALRSEKEVWNTHYQLIGEYIMLRKQQFQTEFQPGEFLTDEIFDTTAVQANEKMAALILGNMWPNGAKSFRFIPTDEIKAKESEEIKEYFLKVTRKATALLDDTRAGLAVALEEYMRDQGGFGTSGIAVFEQNDFKVPIIFKAWDVKGMAIDEGATGLVDTIYNTEMKTVRQIIQEYGYDKVSKIVRDRYDTGKTEDKVKVLHAIEPRMERNPNNFGNKNMPIASIHIEIDTGKVLKESGFEEMPVMVTRFTKAMNEKYGRSPAMLALSDIIELNTIWEAVTIAIEKNMDPPLAVYEDGTFGGGVINTSPGAINVVSVSSRVSAQNPIWQIQTVGDIRSVEALITKLENSITQAFLLDRLLDLNNETQMTAFEANIRNKIRGESTSMYYKRQETELFTPLLTRVFNIMFKKGLAGVKADSEEHQELLKLGIDPILIPGELLLLMESGRDFYKIQYISPAKRAMEAEEAQGILTTFEFATNNAAVAPQILDNLDVDGIVKRIAEITGIPRDLISSTEKVEKLREIRAKQQAQMAQIVEAEQASKVAMNMAQAQAMANKQDQNLEQ